MFKLKPGVSVNGLKPEMNVAIQAVSDLFGIDGYDVIITSGVDGVHSRTSLHYVGYALDFRTRHIPRGRTLQYVQKLKQHLGSEFDVLFESSKESEHMHIEFQPKRIRT